jgi:hypothetical protein
VMASVESDTEEMSEAEKKKHADLRGDSDA